MELCLSAEVLESSPLAPYFLGKPQVLWDGWDDIVAALGRKVSCRRSIITRLDIGNAQYYVLS